MYRIEKRPFGFKLTFGGFMQADEMARWKQDSERELASQKAGFGVLVDMRTLKPLPPDAQALMVDGQKLYKVRGMTRSAVILDSAITTAQFQKLARESGIYAWERYINAAAVTDWQQVGEAWIERSVDPDK